MTGGLGCSVPNTTALTLSASALAPYTGNVVAYLRVSHAVEDGRTFDEQQQTQREAIARLAEREGIPAPVTEFIDWDKSADPAKEHKRTGLTAMLRAIEAGEVTAVYASSRDRLYRSLLTFMRILSACDKHGVRVVTEREGALAGPGASPSAIAFDQMTAVMGELELNNAKARARARVARQKANNVRMGAFPYGMHPGEDLPAVLDAFMQAGSYAGATVLLNDRNIPTRSVIRFWAAGNHGPMQARWESSVVRHIVMSAEEGGLLGQRILPRRRGRGGRGIRQRHVFSGLLRCPHDGSRLTATWRSGRSGRTPAYFCRVGRNTADHPRPWNVSEHVILSWAKDALGDVLQRPEPVGQTILGPDGAVIAGPADHARDILGRIEVLRERKRLLGRVLLSGAMDEAGFDKAITEVDAELARLNTAPRGEEARLPIDWDMAAPDLNIRLSELLHTIVLDARLRPLGAVWRLRPYAPLELAYGDERTVVRLVQPDEDFDFDPAAEPVDGGWLLLHTTSTPGRPQLSDRASDTSAKGGRIAG